MNRSPKSVEFSEPDGQRDARQLQATMDHTDIRGLGTALHRSVAGRPRSKAGDHPVRCPHSPSEGSPHRVPRVALPIRFVRRLHHWEVSSCGLCGWDSAWNDDLLADAQNKARQFSRDRHADLVVLHAARSAFPIPMVQAQLCAPGDGADVGRLALLTLLQRHSDARWEAVVPRRLNQDSAYVGVAGFCNRPKPALVPAGVLGRHQPEIAPQLTRMSKAPELSELSNQRGRSAPARARRSDPSAA